jgi:P4 family phage/plasmid primase-like protien
MTDTNKYKDLKQFLFKHKKTGNEYTHNALGNPPHSYPGSYNIQVESSEEFLEHYINDVIKNKKNSYLTESHTKISPILIDLDFRFKSDIKDRQYTLDSLKEFLNYYINELNNYVNIDDYDVSAYIMEKKKPNVVTKKNITKDGVHIMFPYLVSEPKIQHVLRHKIVQNPKCKELFEKLNIINPIEDIVDASVIERNGWLLYGSKKPNGEPYVLTHILKYNQKSDIDDKQKEHFKDNLEEIKNTHNNEDLVRILSIRNKKEADVMEIREDKLAKLERAFEKLPVKHRLKKKSKLNKKKTKQTKNKCDNINFVRKLVNLLSGNRAESFENWIRVGWCLHNIDYDLLQDWVKFSKKSSKFEEGSCEMHWDNMEDKGLTIGTLRYWAKEDDKEGYEKVVSEDIETKITKSLNETHSDVAKVVHLLYKNEFICCSLKKKKWYQFINHKWKVLDDGIELRKRISNQVVNEYLKVCGSISTRAGQMEEGHPMKDIEMAKVKKLSKISLKLRTSNFKKNVFDECCELFYKEKFEEALDQKDYLLGFKNGVYDLALGEFRAGVPEDYISYCTNIDYTNFREDQEADEEELSDVWRFLEQVLPKPQVREYVVTLLSSFLSGKTSEEKFHIWTGCHSKDTNILMHDGSIKKVQNITEGDQLMGPDSKPRNVLELKRGESDMYKIKSNKFNDFIVNGGHIMCLKSTNTIGFYNNIKENRIKLKWQEYDIEGYPINKVKNFPYKSDTRQICRKNVQYYETTEEAIEAIKEHIEILKNNDNVIKNGDIVEIPVVEYIRRKKQINERNYSLYSNSVEFSEKELDLDPYVLGYWLGDGTSRCASITTMDQEVIDYFEEYRQTLNIKATTYKKPSKAVTITYTSKQRGGRPNKDGSISGNYHNPFYIALKNNNVINNKHIPYKFKCNSEQNRLELLAGIIDSDGHYQKKSKQYEITLKNEALIDDIEYLSKSLGFWCRKKIVTKKCYNSKNDHVGQYYNLIIYGDIYKIPVKLERKQASARMINKDHLKFGFKIEKVQDDNYYGFRVDNDHRYFTGDFIVHHNCGGNGKSKILELFELCFGDYCCKLPITIITRARGGGEAASPALARTKGKRFACLQEPEANESINVGLMKELTGGDTIMARGLHQDPFEFKPKFKMILTCNDLPSVSANDRGTWRRIRVVEFISKFTENPSEDPDDHEYPIDFELSDKLKEWPQAFMYILTQYHELYKKCGIKEPREVTMQTAEYENDSDVFKQFFNGKIVELDDYNGKPLTLDDAYIHFQNWFKQACPTLKVPSRKDLKSSLVKKYGKCENNKCEWKGITCIMHEKDFIKDDSDHELDI